MANDIFTHNGYSGSIEFSIEDECLHGRILFIDDLVVYEGETLGDLRKAFEEAVDRYLEMCKATGTPANKPYSGTFNVRIGPELHREAARAAYLQGKKLNEYVAQAIRTAVCNSEAPTVRLLHRSAQ